MRLLKRHDTSTYRYLALTKLLFVLLVTWKWDSSRFMKLLVGEYRAFVEHLFVILAAWKSDFFRVVKSSNRGTLLHVNHSSTFWQQGSWKPRNKGILLSLVTLRHFEGLKMRFLWCPETLGSRLCEYRWVILDI